MQNKKNQIVKYFWVVLLILPLGVVSQEFNYWMNAVGSRSNMFAGAVTAGVEDNSADAMYSQISISLGFTYFFPHI